MTTEITTPEYNEKRWNVEKEDMVRDAVTVYVSNNLEGANAISFLENEAWIFHGNDFSEQHIEYIEHVIKEIREEARLIPIREKARELLSEPLSFWQELFSLTSTLIVGEDRKKELLFLTALCKEHNYLLGPSSVGKTYLKNAIKKLYPPEWTLEVGELSDKALKYIDWEGEHKDVRILLLQEFVGVSENQDKQIRLTYSDDGGMQTATTYRDPESGHFKTQFNNTPPLGFISTTTKMSLNNENLTRAWSISPDRSENQTKAIIERDNNFAKYPHTRPHLGERLDIFREALKLIDVDRWKSEDGNKFFVAQPFIDIIDFPTGRVRMRRDRAKVERLAAIITVVNQKHRMRFKQNGVEYLIGTLWDLQLALWLIEESFEDTVSGLSERHRKVFDRIQDLKDKWTDDRKEGNEEQETEAQERLADVKQSIEWAGATSKEISEKLDISQNLCTKAANALYESGYLYRSQLEARGNPYIYTIKEEPEVTLTINMDKAKDTIKEWYSEMGFQEECDFVVFLESRDFNERPISQKTGKGNNTEKPPKLFKPEMEGSNNSGFRIRKTDSALEEKELLGACEPPEMIISSSDDLRKDTPSKQSDKKQDAQPLPEITKDDILADYCRKIVNVADENDLISDKELRNLFTPLDRMIEIRDRLFDNKLVRGISADTYQLTSRCKNLVERIEKGGA